MPNEQIDDACRKLIDPVWEISDMCWTSGDSDAHAVRDAADALYEALNAYAGTWSTPPADLPLTLDRLHYETRNVGSIRYDGPQMLPGTRMHTADDRQMVML